MSTQLGVGVGGPDPWCWHSGTTLAPGPGVTHHAVLQPDLEAQAPAVGAPHVRAALHDDPLYQPLLQLLIVLLLDFRLHFPAHAIGRTLVGHAGRELKQHGQKREGVRESENSSAVTSAWQVLSSSSEGRGSGETTLALSLPPLASWFCLHGTHLG